MDALELIDLMRNFTKGNTIRLKMINNRDEYVVNNKQYTMLEFTRLVVLTRKFIVIYENV